MKMILLIYLYCCFVFGKILEKQMLEHKIISYDILQSIAYRLTNFIPQTMGQKHISLGATVWSTLRVLYRDVV